MNVSYDGKIQNQESNNLEKIKLMQKEHVLSLWEEVEDSKKQYWNVAWPPLMPQDICNILKLDVLPCHKNYKVQLYTSQSWRKTHQTQKYYPFERASEHLIWEKAWRNSHFLLNLTYALVSTLTFLQIFELPMPSSQNQSQYPTM